LSLVTEINFILKFDQKVTTGHHLLTATCWSEKESDATKIASLKIDNTTVKQDNTYSFYDLSQACRYIRIEIKNNTKNNGAATLSLNIHGEHEYLSPSLDREILLPKLKSQLQTAEQKQLSLSLDFDSKRKQLTSILEEISISENSFQDIQMILLMLMINVFNYN